MRTSLVYVSRDHPRVVERLPVLADLPVEWLRRRGLEITSPLDDAERTAIVAARVPGIDPAEIATRLRSPGRRLIAKQRRPLLPPKSTPSMPASADPI